MTVEMQYTPKEMAKKLHDFIKMIRFIDLIWLTITYSA